jgi:uncharacterized protein with HEPN domain
MRTIAARLADARDHARQAARYVDGIDDAVFAANAMIKDAVCFCLMVVGEACAEAVRELPAAPAEIPWAEIKGMRNILVHEYWQIDETIIYNVARDEARPLADRLDHLIKSVDHS